MDSDADKRMPSKEETEHDGESVIEEEDVKYIYFSIIILKKRCG